MLSSSIHARLYDIPMSRAAAEIEPVSRMLSSSAALPGPMRAPDSKTMLTLTRAMPALCHARVAEARLFFQDECNATLIRGSLIRDADAAAWRLRHSRAVAGNSQSAPA